MEGKGRKGGEGSVPPLPFYNITVVNFIIRVPWITGARTKMSPGKMPPEKKSTVASYA